MKHSFGFFQHGNPPEVHLVTGSYFSNMAKRKTALPDNGVVSCGESDFHKNYALQNVNSQVVVGRKDCFVYIAAVEAVVVVVVAVAAGPHLKIVATEADNEMNNNDACLNWKSSHLHKVHA